MALSTMVFLLISKAHLPLEVLLLVINSHSLVSPVSRLQVRVKLQLFLEISQVLQTTVTTTSSITTVENPLELTNLSTLVFQEDNLTLHSKDQVLLFTKPKPSYFRSMIQVQVNGLVFFLIQLTYQRQLLTPRTSQFPQAFLLLTSTSSAGFNNLVAEMHIKKSLPFGRLFFIR
jgi:hypothetical protein